MLSAIALVAAIAGSAAVVRTAGLGREPLFVDEAFSARFSVGSPVRMLDLTARDTHPPLYYVGLSAWRRLFGGSVLALRSFSLLWSLIGLGALALLARQLVGDRGAVFAVIAAAVVHPLDVHFAQTARMYSQLAALSTLAAWLLWRWMISAGNGERWREFWRAAAYGATAILMLYTHYLSAVVLVAQGLFGLAYFARKGRWFSFAAYLVCAVAAAAAFVPWIAKVLRFRDGLYSVGHLRWIPVPGLEDGIGMVFRELMWGPAPFRAPWALFMSAAAVCCVVSATFLLVRSLIRPTADPSPARFDSLGLRVGYAAWLLFGTVVLALGVSWVYQPIFYPPRFAVVVLPPFLILLGLAVAEIHSVRWKRFSVAFFVGLMMISAVVETVVISTARLDDLIQLWGVEREPDLVVFFPAYTAKTSSYYLGKRVRSATRDDVESLVAAGVPVRLWICTTREWRPRVSSDSAYHEWLLARGRNEILVETDALQVVQVQVGRLEKSPTEPVPAGDLEFVIPAPARGSSPPGRGGP